MIYCDWCIIKIVSMMDPNYVTLRHMSMIVKKYCEKYCVFNITQTQIGVRYIGKLEKQ